MRRFMLGFIASMALLIPRVGSAQVYEVRSAPEVRSPPELTAASADWQVNNELMPVAGLVYAPMSEFRLFDAQVMVQIGVYKGVPVFADATLEPWSVVYVPIGGGRLRTYERVRETNGVPEIPIGSTAAPAVADVPRAPAAAPAPAPAAISNVRWTPTHVESIPSPHGKSGVWLEFRGQRWYSDGTAVPYSADRFVRIGEYRDFPVYRDRNGRRDLIWVSVVQDGPLAPYVIR